MLIEINNYSDIKICDYQFSYNDFEKVYGELGRHFIEVHHKIPLSKIGKNYIVNPKKDLLFKILTNGLITSTSTSKYITPF